MRAGILRISYKALAEALGLKGHEIVSSFQTYDEFRSSGLMLKVMGPAMPEGIEGSMTDEFFIDEILDLIDGKGDSQDE